MYKLWKSLDASKNDTTWLNAFFKRKEEGTIARLLGKPSQAGQGLGRIGKERKRRCHRSASSYGLSNKKKLKGEGIFKRRDNGA